MNGVRPGASGATRVCPHCKATVLASAAICPGCRHHLRFNPGGTQLEAGEGYCALSVDGTIAHNVTHEPCEYCVVLDIRNERGEQVARHVVGVGALQPGEQRRLNVSVEMLPVRAAVPAPPASKTPAPAITQTPIRPPPLPPTPSQATTRSPAQPAPQKSAPPPAAALKSALPPLQPPGLKPQAPASSLSVGQRLRIFRKP